MEKVLEISHLSKKFGQQYALNDVNLTIRKGDVYGLIGKNGAGKTTLIKIITQLIQETDGSVSLFASTNRSQWTQALKRVGSVIESPVAHKHMTAYQNLVYYCKARHIPNPDQVIKETLNYVGLNNTGKKKFRDFSLGMKQRLGIAIALIAKPDFLILDEPINGLDPVGIKEFRQMIKRLNDELGMTILISSHILSELYLVANRFGIVDQGRLIILKTSQLALASQLIQDQLHHRIKVIDKDGEIHIFGQTHDIKVIVKALVQADIDVDEIYYARQDLEKFFTDLVD